MDDDWGYPYLQETTISHDSPIIIPSLPSGKRLHSYGTSPFFRAKSTISMDHFP